MPKIYVLGRRKWLKSRVWDIRKVNGKRICKLKEGSSVWNI